MEISRVAETTPIPSKARKVKARWLRIAYDPETVTLIVANIWDFDPERRILNCGENCAHFRIMDQPSYSAWARCENPSMAGTILKGPLCPYARPMLEAVVAEEVE